MESISTGWLLEVRLLFGRTLLGRVPAAHHALEKLHEKEEDNKHSPALPDSLKKTAFHIRQSQRGYRWNQEATEEEKIVSCVFSECVDKTAKNCGHHTAHVMHPQLEESRFYVPASRAIFW